MWEYLSSVTDEQWTLVAAVGAVVVSLAGLVVSAMTPVRVQRKQAEASTEQWLRERRFDVYASFIDADTAFDELIGAAMQDRENLQSHAVILEERRVDNSATRQRDDAELAELNNRFEASCAAMVEGLGTLKSAASRVRTIGSTQVQSSALAYTQQVARAAAQVLEGVPTADIIGLLADASTHSYALMYRDLGVLTPEQRKHVKKRISEQKAQASRPRVEHA